VPDGGVSQVHARREPAVRHCAREVGVRVGIGGVVPSHEAVSRRVLHWVAHLHHGVCGHHRCCFVVAVAVDVLAALA